MVTEEARGATKAREGGQGRAARAKGVDGSGRLSSDSGPTGRVLKQRLSSVLHNVLEVASELLVALKSFCQA